MPYESDESENYEGNHSWGCDGLDSNLSCPRGLIRLRRSDVQIRSETVL